MNRATLDAGKAAIISLAAAAILAGVACRRCQAAGRAWRALNRRGKLTSSLIKDHGVREIVFVERKSSYDGHWYANIGYWAVDVEMRLSPPGGSLSKLDLKTGVE